MGNPTLISNAPLLGQESTHSRHVMQSTLLTVIELCTTKPIGQDLVQSLQEVQVSSFRLM
jgi:hypothetical protein